MLYIAPGLPGGTSMPRDDFSVGHRASRNAAVAQGAIFRPEHGLPLFAHSRECDWRNQNVTARIRLSRNGHGTST